MYDFLIRSKDYYKGRNHHSSIRINHINTVPQQTTILNIPNLFQSNKLQPIETTVSFFEEMIGED